MIRGSTTELMGSLLPTGCDVETVFPQGRGDDFSTWPRVSLGRFFKVNAAQAAVASSPGEQWTDCGQLVLQWCRWEDDPKVLMGWEMGGCE